MLLLLGCYVVALLSFLSTLLVSFVAACCRLCVLSLPPSCFIFSVSPSWSSPRLLIALILRRTRPTVLLLLVVVPSVLAKGRWICWRLGKVWTVAIFFTSFASAYLNVLAFFWPRRFVFSSVLAAPAFCCWFSLSCPSACCFRCVLSCVCSLLYFHRLA